ncbi:MAG: NAD(P)-dependent oxidoreductase [Akkermansia sp.]|nr:NAD(P)-dependent oxidoreductase [Akkermansia sp.]
MKYIVTGATSFIGQELVRQLLDGGHEVVAVCRENSGKAPLLPQEVEIVYSDMGQYGRLDTRIPRADVFIHLAWDGTSHAGRDARQTQLENIDHTISAIHAAKRMGCALFVESGSQAEYGSVTTTISEDTPCHPFSEYGKAKLEIKERGFALAEELGIKYLHLRIFSIYGERDHGWTLVMTAVEKMMRNEPLDLSSCEQQWNFLHVEDAGRQICALCTHAIHSPSFCREIFNIASTDTRKLKEFVECIKAVTASQSQLSYGVLSPQNTVSLNPDTSKTAAIVSTDPGIPFTDGILRIIQHKLPAKLTPQ